MKNPIQPNIFWGIVNYLAFIVCFSLSIMGIVVVVNYEDPGLTGIGILFFSIVFLFGATLLTFFSPLPKQNAQIFKKRYIREIFNWSPYLILYLWGLLILFFDFVWEGLMTIAIFMFMFPIFYYVVKDLENRPSKKWQKKRKK